MGMCSALELTTRTAKLWKLWKSTLKIKVCLPFPLICCHHKASTDSRSRNRWYWVQAWTRNTCTRWHTNWNKDTQKHRHKVLMQRHFKYFLGTGFLPWSKEIPAVESALNGLSVNMFTPLCKKSFQNRNIFPTCAIEPNICTATSS